MMKFDEKVLKQVVVMDESGKVDLEASCAQCPYCAECEKTNSYYACSVWESAMEDDL